MDIKLQNEEWKLKMRVAGCIVKDNKVLCAQMCENKFLCLPGGHIEFGESTKEAVIREMKEEVGFDCKILNLICVIESFYQAKDKKVHEICYFYLMEPLKNIVTQDYIREENDKGELKRIKFKWVELENLKKVDFRPQILTDKLAQKNWAFEHKIYNELK